VNVDFADVRTVMQNGGSALMGTGIGRGDDRAITAAQQAISSPLLDNISISGSSGVLLNITGGEDLTLGEVTQISDIIHEAAGDQAEIIFGTAHDAAMEGEIRVTVIATGFDKPMSQQETMRPGPPAGVLPFPQKTVRPSSPSVAMPQAVSKRPAAPPQASAQVSEMEIPTFIRRQMD
jgi:cell division protein FtsZ